MPGQGGLLRGACRLQNAWRRYRAGLPARGGVSPEAPNDLYQAHLALYLFAARRAPGRRVLDWGCGTGYGTARLAAAGTQSVLGLDPDPRSIRYAQRRFAGSGADFRAGDLEGAAGPFDLIFVPYLLPQSPDPHAAVAQAARLLAADGALIAAVPPIVDEHAMEAHRASGTNRTNLYLWDWESLLRRSFRDLQLFGLAPPPGTAPDFTDPRPSRLKAEDFTVAEVAFSAPSSVGTLSAIFVGKSAQPAGVAGR
jgi:SAM-dependent methyltransferase